MPRISIGLPVYNGETFIAQAVASLLEQSFADFELLIADNASTDRTAEICRDLAAGDPRVRFLPSEVNRGAAWNFNRVFHEARGEYFKWAAADDICGPTLLERCVEVLDREPEVVLCHGRTGKIDAQGKVIGAYDLDNNLDVANPRVHLRFRGQILPRHTCVHVFGLIRREVLARTPLIGAYVSSDRVLLAELVLHGPHHIVPETLFFRRHHPGTSIHLDEWTERAAWFNPDLAGGIALPAWRVARELVAAVTRAPLGWEDRGRCLVEVLRHCKYRRVSLGRDLVMGWKFYTGQLKPR